MAETPATLPSPVPDRPQVEERRDEAAVLPAGLGVEQRDGLAGQGAVEGHGGLFVAVVGEERGVRQADGLVGGVAVEAFGAGAPVADDAPGVEGVDAVVGRLQQRRQPGLGLLGPLRGDVAQGRPGAGDLPAAVAGGHGPERHLEAEAVAARPCVSKVSIRWPRAAAARIRGKCRRVFAGEEHGHLPADDLLGPVPEERGHPVTPARDDPVEGYDESGHVGSLHDAPVPPEIAATASDGTTGCRSAATGHRHGGPGLAERCFSALPSGVTSRTVRLATVCLAVLGASSVCVACDRGDAGAAMPVLGLVHQPRQRRPGGAGRGLHGRVGRAVPHHGLDPAQRRLGAAGAARPAAGGQGPVDRPDEPRPAVRGRVRRGRLPPAVHRRGGARASPTACSTGRWSGATWDGRLVAAPFWANSQLLWYRKSAAAAGRARPGRGPGHLGAGHRRRRAGRGAPSGSRATATRATWC